MVVQDVVRVGSRVVIRFGELEESWEIVAPHEADALKGLISEMSPLGRALLGHQSGETVLVRAQQPYRVTIATVG